MKISPNNIVRTSLDICNDNYVIQLIFNRTIMVNLLNTIIMIISNYWMRLSEICSPLTSNIVLQIIRKPNPIIRYHSLPGLPFRRRPV